MIRHFGFRLWVANWPRTRPGASRPAVSFKSKEYLP
jgi:hypothetical protein